MMRYRSLVDDNARWEGFEFRSGDIVISTPKKCGTTWTQMLCALLIFDGPVFPEPLEQLSPWLDMCNLPIDEVRAALARQAHRRFIKTHTPLDGLPVRHDVTYVVTGRDPRDAAVSFEHHATNMDYDRFLELRAAAMGNDDLADMPPRRVPLADPLEQFRRFVRDDALAGAPTLAATLHHLDTAWRRRHDGNIVLCHYADFTRDLVGELQRLAAALRIDLDAARAARLAPEAVLDRMRERAQEIAPAASRGNWKDPRAFFRSGGFGEWRDRLTPEDVEEYARRVAELATPDLASWAHLGRLASGIDPAS
jgi:aryl sulfotransferase